MPKYACLCEGAFEQAVIDILLDYDCLKLIVKSY